MAAMAVLEAITALKEVTVVGEAKMGRVELGMGTLKVEWGLKVRARACTKAVRGRADKVVVKKATMKAAMEYVAAARETEKEAMVSEAGSVQASAPVKTSRPGSIQPAPLMQLTHRLLTLAT